MSYPLSPMPSFDELRNRLKDEFDCALTTIDSNTFPLKYFERTHLGEKLQCPISFNDDNEILTPIVLSYICRRLKIDPGLFGLTLE